MPGLGGPRVGLGGPNGGRGGPLKNGDLGGGPKLGLGLRGPRNLGKDFFCKSKEVGEKVL